MYHPFVKSPFEYTTPEAISAQDVIDLFVPVFSEYYNVPSIGHTFIHGSRGCGKSMMFRYMSPDCQTVVTSNAIKDLDYFAIYIPIKEGQFNKSDLQLLEKKHGEALLNEHLMIVSFSIKIFEAISEVNYEDNTNTRTEVINFYNNWFSTHLKYSGWETPINSLNENSTIQDVFKEIKDVFVSILRTFTKEYLHKLIGNIEALPYNGAICTFVDFLYPLIKELKKLVIFPKKPFYLLVDDADDLSYIQTLILNQWVSLRTTKDVCFKISTQLKYKTYRTISNSRIDTPHDYTEINIIDIYTSDKSIYKDRVKKAVEKRLAKYGFPNITAEEFFPQDKQQKKKLDKKFSSYKSEHDYDYAYRYTTPDFIRDDLEGNRYTFSYAGFDQLVNISSGVMRHFIEFANKMFVRQISDSAQEPIKFIAPSIQDEEIKDYSKWFLHENFETLKKDDKEGINNDYVKLGNLIQALGQTFHLILISDSSERRVFSFALQDEPSEELKNILDLGVQCGYFQKSLIGNKYGTGRSRLYILTRLLAPYFKLDPSSFAGYKFVMCQILQRALVNPQTVIGKIKKEGVNSFFSGSGQLDIGFNAE